jgi:hypothetical protein
VRGMEGVRREVEEGMRFVRWTEGPGFRISLNSAGCGRSYGEGRSNTEESSIEGFSGEQGLWGLLTGGVGGVTEWWCGKGRQRDVILVEVGFIKVV